MNKLALETNGLCTYKTKARNVCCNHTKITDLTHPLNVQPKLCKMLKIKADMNGKRILSMIHALAAVFVKLAGPYWDITTSKTISYLDLETVKIWLENPELMLTVTANSPIKKTLPIFRNHENHAKIVKTTPAELTFFTEMGKALLKGIGKSINLQLHNFLKGGKY